MEATYLDEESEMAQSFGHTTAKKAAMVASEAGARKLILNHISRRYRDEEIQEEARAIFPESYVARDFDSFQIKRAE